nr:hypothetical protein [Olegusella massiliensis]
MSQFFEITRVEVGPRKLTARVHLADDAPLMTSDDLEGTARVYYLLPHIVDHVCLGDSSKTFKDVMGNTELAHLLEHTAVELLAQTDIAGDTLSGRTFTVPDDLRAWDIELVCTDDVLVAGALVSASWLLQWAYTDGSDPKPDVKATVQGLIAMVESLDTTDEDEYVGEDESESAEEESEAMDDGEPELEEDEDAEPEAMDDGEPELEEDEDAAHAEQQNTPADDLLDSMPEPRILR